MASVRSGRNRGGEPMPRFLHTSWQTSSGVLIHGGRTKKYSKKAKQGSASVVEIFDPFTELWHQKKVTGKTPAHGMYAAASASLNDDLFTFGGYDGRKFHNLLHRLKYASRWFELCPQNENDESPMAKIGAGMVVYDDNLAVFGGYGIPHGPTQPGSSFVRDTKRNDGRGWTNEFHVYNLENGM